MRRTWTTWAAAGKSTQVGAQAASGGAPHPPPVRGVDARDGWDILPGQGLERLAQGLLVALDGEHVVTATLGGSTRRYRFGCAWRQWLPRPRPGRGAQASLSEPGPLVGLVRHPLLGQYSACGVVQSGQEVRRRVLVGAGCAHSPTVHRDHPAPLDGACRRAQP